MLMRLDEYNAAMMTMTASGRRATKTLVRIRRFTSRPMSAPSMPQLGPLNEERAIGVYSASARQKLLHLSVQPQRYLQIVAGPDADPRARVVHQTELPFSGIVAARWEPNLELLTLSLGFVGAIPDTAPA